MKLLETILLIVISNAGFVFTKTVVVLTSPVEETNEIQSSSTLESQHNATFDSLNKFVNFNTLLSNIQHFDWKSLTQEELSQLSQIAVDRLGSTMLSILILEQMTTKEKLNFSMQILSNTSFEEIKQYIEKSELKLEQEQLMRLKQLFLSEMNNDSFVALIETKWNQLSEEQQEAVILQMLGDTSSNSHSKLLLIKDQLNSLSKSELRELQSIIVSKVGNAITIVSYDEDKPEGSRKKSSKLCNYLRTVLKDDLRRMEYILARNFFKLSLKDQQKMLKLVPGDLSFFQFLSLLNNSLTKEIDVLCTAKDANLTKQEQQVLQSVSRFDSNLVLNYGKLIVDDYVENPFSFILPSNKARQNFSPTILQIIEYAHERLRYEEQIVWLPLVEFSLALPLHQLVSLNANQPQYGQQVYVPYWDLGK